jgi:hypothetical protein
MGTFMTLIRIGLLYPSIHNSFITNKQIEVKLVQHMVFQSDEKPTVLIPLTNVEDDTGIPKTPMQRKPVWKL